MTRSLISIPLIAAIVAMATIPVCAQQDRGHGSIYYSPSGHRIGWAKSLADDPTANHIAHAFCQGGQIDSQSLSAYGSHQGGASVTSGNATSINTPVFDCFKVVKFDSNDNHQCGGFGYNIDGTYSRGVRASDVNAVKNDISSWNGRFIACNDDSAVSSGSKDLAAGIAVLAVGLAALFGHHHASSSTSTASSGTVAYTQTGPITFNNATTLQVPLQIKCGNPESSYRTFSVGAGQSQSIDPTSWGDPPCYGYDIRIRSTDSSGRETTFHRTTLWQPGGPYTIVVNSRRQDIEVAGAAPSTSGVTVINDTTSALHFSLLCTGQPSIAESLNAGASSTYPLACSTGQLSLPSAETIVAFPIVSGATYHLRWDSNAQEYTLVR